MINGPIWNESELSANDVFPTILAIGDSWFWYPKNNLATPLHKILNRNKAHIMLVRGHNGAESIEYMSGPIRAQIEIDLDKIKGYGKTLKAVFISGGGNDFAGKDDMLALLQKNCSTANTSQQCFKNNQPKILFGKVQSALLSVVDLVQKKIPGTPVFVHGYDYANPNGKGFFGIGQWLQYPMDSCNVRRDLHQAVVNMLIDQFRLILENTCNQAPTLRLVDERNTLKPDDWANELHPTMPGFNRLAKCWKPVLESAGIA